MALCNLKVTDYRYLFVSSTKIILHIIPNNLFFSIFWNRKGNRDLLNQVRGDMILNYPF